MSGSLIRMEHPAYTHSISLRAISSTFGLNFFLKISLWLIQDNSSFIPLKVYQAIVSASASQENCT